jgi:hypothetical protein
MSGKHVRCLPRCLPQLMVVLSLFPPDPSTFGGAVAVAVVGGIILALLLGIVRLLSSRGRLRPGSASSPVGEVDPRHGYVADLATGIRQAAMALREAIELFGRAVLVDPDTGGLEENSWEVLTEAHRTVDEAEARLPRVELVLGNRAAMGRRAVEELRRALSQLTNYIRRGRRLELRRSRGCESVAQGRKRIRTQILEERASLGAGRLPTPSLAVGAGRASALGGHPPPAAEVASPRRFGWRERYGFFRRRRRTTSPRPSPGFGAISARTCSHRSRLAAAGWSGG